MTVKQIISVDALKRSDPPGTSSLCQSGVVARLIRGCFIKVRLEHHSFWAEVQNIHDTRVDATIRHLVDHNAAGAGDAAQWLGKLVTVTGSTIEDTGCDTLCWC